MRRWVIVIFITGAVAGLAWGTIQFIEARRFESRLAQAWRDAASGRFDESREWLITLPPSRASNPEVADLLGACEHAARNYEGALAAWSKIPPGSPRFIRASLARARTLVGDLGRFADAEVVLETALRQRGQGRGEVRDTLGQLYFWESRRDAMRRLILDGWSETSRPAEELRDLWQINDATVQLDEVSNAVEDAARLAPDDDRVWLAQAGLAMQAGHFQEAERLLDSCLKERPNDPAVWRARLQWARGADNFVVAENTLQHLPADSLSDAECLELRAWLAAKRGQTGEEQKALDALIEKEPGQTRALERLAVLASQAGMREQAETLRHRKAVMDEAKDRYRRLLVDHVPTERLPELAELADTLGRRFEAKGWWLLASRIEPENPKVAEAIERLRGQREAAPQKVSGTLADRLNELQSQDPAVSSKTVLASASAGPIPEFSDDAEKAGLSFVFENGRSPQCQLPETTAGGVGLLDYDGDGWLDVYVVQGGAFPPSSEKPHQGDRLFRNKGDGSFEDVTSRAGLPDMSTDYSHGVTVGDFDNDGRPDLFVTRWRKYALYHNQGDGRFEEVTSSVGLGGDRDWPTSAAFADLDRDGDLDLYVCHYLVWDAEHPTLCKREHVTDTKKQVNPDRIYSYCMPRPFPALQDHLFRNDGGHFADVTAEAGIVDRDGRGLGVVAADVDDDGKIDLFVANDTTANYLWHNKGGMKFEEMGFSNGVACNADGAFQAGMGTACGDLDGDGRPDLLVTNFYGESTTFFHNLGGGLFGDETASIGLSAASRFLLGFGISLFDANNDGRLDLATANGHVLDDRPKFPYEMPTLLMLGGEQGRLTDVTEKAGAPWRVPRVGRGLAAGDLDNDGRVDLLILPQKSALGYFHNRTSEGHSITFLLEGKTSNRDAVGARVTVVSGARRQVAQRTGGGSFQSSRDPRLHFGLGSDAQVAEVEVRWPSGHVDRYADLKADSGYHLREGDSTPRPLIGFRQSRVDSAKGR